MARSRLRSALVAISSAGLIASSLWVAPVSNAADSPEPSPIPSAEPTPDESPSPEPSASPSPETEASPTASPTPLSSASPSPSTTPSTAASPSPTTTEPCDDDSPCLLPPRITDATPKATEIAVAWEWPEGASNFGDGVGVVLEVTPGDVELVANDDVTTAVIAGLFPETIYTIVAYAVRGTGDAEERSAGSEPFTVTTLAEGPIRPTAESGDIFRLIVTTYSDADPSAGAQSATAELAVDGVEVSEVREIGNEGVVIELDKGVSESTARAITDELERDPRIESVELDSLARLTAFPVDPPDDPKWTDDSLWGLYGTYGVGIASDRLTMNNVWTSGQGTGAIVAVLDTGYTAHPDLDANYVAGYDFVSNSSAYTSGCGSRSSATSFDGDYVDTATYGALGWDNNPLDPGDWENCASSSWHGTHVAGTVAAVGNNSVGIIGVAPAAKVQPIRVLSYAGGWNSDIAAGITWASGGSVGGGVPMNSNPADVINLSLGGQQSCPASIQTAINAAVSNGSVVVVSAGNSNLDASLFSPANCDNVITVASSTSSGTRSTFSNFGSTVEITAPGSGIWSTLNSGSTTPVAATYASYSGTSMAAPHVSGVAALLKAADDTRTTSQILSLMQITAQTFPVTGSGFDCTTSVCGSGLLTASAAISTAPSATSLTPTTGSTAGGVAVTITGTNLLGTTSVSFGGAAATGLIVNSATSVTVTTPARAAGSTDVVVTTTGGSSTLTSAFTFVTPPSSSGGSSSGAGGTGDSGGGGGGGAGGWFEIQGVGPTSGPVSGGTEVTITGYLSSAVGVMFGAMPAASTQVIDEGTIKAVSPAASGPGSVDVIVLFPAHVGPRTWANAFTYISTGTTATTNAPADSSPQQPESASTRVAPEPSMEFLTFKRSSTNLTPTTRMKLRALANEYTGQPVDVKVVTYINSQATDQANKRAQVRGERIASFLKQEGIASEPVVDVVAGGTSLQQRGAIVSIQPTASTPSSTNQVQSIIIRLNKGRSPLVDGEVRGASRVTAVPTDSLTLGANLGLRMYRIDFAMPVSPQVAQRVADQLSRDPGIAFAEPDSLVSAQQSIGIRSLRFAKG